MSRKNLSVDDVIAEVQSRREKERRSAPETEKPALQPETAQTEKNDLPETAELSHDSEPEETGNTQQPASEESQSEEIQSAESRDETSEEAAEEDVSSSGDEENGSALSEETLPEESPLQEGTPVEESATDRYEDVSDEDTPANVPDSEFSYAPLGRPQHFIRNEAFARLFKEEAAFYTSRNQSEETPEDPEDLSIYETSLENLDFELEEYDEPAKKQAVSESLAKKQRETLLSLLGSGVCALAALIFVITGHFKLVPQQYTLVYLFLVLISALVNFRSFISGLHGLFTLRATHDSAVSLASCAAVIQCVTVLIDPDSFRSGSLFVYAPIVACAWFLNAFGRFSALRRISRNFLFLTSSEEKYAVSLLEDNADCVKIAGNYIERQPLVAFQKRANFYDRFIYNSVKSDPSRFIVQMVAPIGLLASLILFGACVILFKDVVSAFTAFTASTCIFIPIAGLLCVNLPVGDLSSLARKWGGMIAGYSSVEKFARTNIVLIDAEDLFPRGSTQLVNIQTFSGSDPQRSILCAASLIKCFSGPLTEVFDQALSNLDLPPVAIESPLYEESLGLSGWAEGNRILVGNRKLMAKYSVAIPPKEIERPYTNKGQQILYISLGGVISAMLILSYKGDSRRAAELARLEKNGYLIVVRSNDVNITPGLVSARFGIDGRIVRILPEKLGPIFTENVETPAEKADSLILTKGRTTTMFRLLTACNIQKSNITFALILQIIAVAIGFIFVAFITCYSGLEQLKTGALLLYELFWLAAIIVVPKLRRP